ncbi:MAG: putative Ig domain-containing protein, partial [Ignavibacteria bacterium]|nr:putative Ig domain-containing protein [Ignavibacteria bacterium]
MKQFILIFVTISFSVLFAQNNNSKENHAPVFVKEMPDTTIGNQNTFRFTIQATDADGDKIKYGSVNTLPAGATINDSTGIFIWKPTSRQAGKHQIIITANDGQLTTQSRTTTITVIPYGDYNSQIVASCKPEEGGKANGALCNVGDTVTVKAFANPGYRFMSWTENNIVVSKDSFYTFIVTGNRNLLANFRVNHAPVFVKEMSDTSILAGRTLPFTYKAIDPEGDSIKYSIFLKSELLMHIDSTSGFFVCRGQHTQVGKNYDLIIAATDGILTTLSKKAIISVYIIPSAQSEIFPTEFKLSPNYPNPFN